MHERAAHESTENLADIRFFGGALSGYCPLEVFAGPDAVDEEEAGEETMPAIAPEIPDGFQFPDTRRVERWEVR